MLMKPDGSKKWLRCVANNQYKCCMNEETKQLVRMVQQNTHILYQLVQDKIPPTNKNSLLLTMAIKII